MTAAICMNVYAYALEKARGFGISTGSGGATLQRWCNGGMLQLLPFKHGHKCHAATVQRSKIRHTHTRTRTRMVKQALHALQRCTSFLFSFISKVKEEKQVQHCCNAGATLSFLNKKGGFYS
jgi:hypothetical protein